MTEGHWSEGSLKSALDDFASSPSLLLGLDFDGTLAPLVDDPTASRMIDSAREALETLTDVPGVTIALITGRAIDSIRMVGDPLPSWWLVGSHGVEIVSPEEREHYSTPNLVPEALEEGFLEIVRGHVGSRFEKKPFGVALHTRGMDSSSALAAEHDAHSFLEKFDGGGTIRLGHGIVEYALKPGHKGEGIRALRERLSVDRVFFAGDDRTDEDGFGVLEHLDIGVRVGDGETAASHRVKDAHEVAEVLWHLHSLRQ